MVELDDYSGSDRLVTLYLFVILGNNLPCHCEPFPLVIAVSQSPEYSEGEAWQSHSLPSPPRLLRRYAPRNDEGKRLLSVIKKCH